MLGVASGQPDIVLMTYEIGVANDRPACLYGGTLGFGPWAHGMALAPLGGPVIRALPNVILVTLVLGVASGQPHVILMTLVLGVASDQTKCLYGGSVGYGPWARSEARRV